MIRRSTPNKIVNNFWHLPKAVIANLMYGFPDKKLTTIGVTGSDGKTTTSNGIYHLLQSNQIKTGLISTIQAKIGKLEIDTGFHVTSPDPFALQKFLQRMVKEKLTHAVLESTSHGLSQHRLHGINFDIGVVTNITHEHLDYHKNYQNYLLAKAKLFDKVKLAVLNIDDKSYQPLRKYIKTHNPQAQIWTYGIKNKQANFLGQNIKLNQRLHYQCHIQLPKHKKQKFTIDFPTPANFNVYNTLAMIAVGKYLNISNAKIKKSLATTPSIPGRMEYLDFIPPLKKGRSGGVSNTKNKQSTIVIDFAHTPNGLKSALQTLQIQSHPRHPELDSGSIKKPKAKNSRLISVFGCAGLRDNQKRPMMGKISAQLADITIITAEDPRTENVNDIIDQIATGCRQSGATEIKYNQVKKLQTQLKARSYKLKAKYIRIPDRQTAITTAIQLSQPGDIIGIFGKGHEQSMCFGTTEHPWSDKKAVQKAIASLANGC